MLELSDGRWIIEIPAAVVKLFSLEEGIEFQMKAYESKNGYVIINLAAKLKE